MLFPELKNKKYRLIDINQEAINWMKQNRKLLPQNDINPFLTPSVVDKMLSDVHKNYSIDWSFGGYLENREYIWRDSYLKESGRFIHLGIDFNVPEGTKVATDNDAEIIIVDDDKDHDGGWGPAVILKPKLKICPEMLLIYAHLRNVKCKAGDLLNKGEIFAEVGSPPHNGGWYPHLHVQVIDVKYHTSEIAINLSNIDGYGHKNNICNLKNMYPNPMAFVEI